MLISIFDEIVNWILIKFLDFNKQDRVLQHLYKRILFEKQIQFKKLLIKYGNNKLLLSFERSKESNQRKIARC